MAYTPIPIDTSGVVLPEALERLTERLAEHAHDRWAQMRMAEGWTCGPRNDAAKTNPCLVPYSDLPESEKAYDRAMAMDTLRAAIALGYRIVGSDVDSH